MGSVTESVRSEVEPAPVAGFEHPVQPREPARAQAEPEAPAYRAPAVGQPYLMPSDMVQVETTHAAPPPQPEGQSEHLPRRTRRPRIEQTAVEDEPLVQVETRPARSGSD